MTRNTHHNRSLFLASVVLVLSGGGFSRSASNDSCRSYSEALATTFYSKDSTRSPLSRSFVKSTAFRGGSSSLFSVEDDVEEISSSRSVNGKSGPKISFEKVNGSSTKAKPAGFGNRQEFDSSIEADKPLIARHVAETNLPTDVGHFRLRAYRVEDAMQEILKNQHVGTEPCVIYSTSKPPFGQKSVPVRIHDQCFTSEVFRSQRCDCKEQLKMSLEYIQEHGGAIIYLQQEGRGIGLANKVAAYALQDVGMDTVDANTHLGFPEDCRQYGVVPSILADMDIESIRLITNNPRKLDRLVALGVNVEELIPMVVERSNPHNRNYLQTKQDRMKHTNFGDMLSLDSRGASGIVEDAVKKLQLEGVEHPKSVAEAYINDGEEMAAAAIASALLDAEEAEVGVTAKEDGYCFGRESVEEAIASVARGEIVVVVDDMDRENEGDFIMASDLCTPETMAIIVRYSSGVICIGMEGKRMDELNLPAMVINSEDPKGTAFSVTVDASSKHGITTGISAAERAKTMTLLGDPKSKVDDFVRPGHVFPLRAKENGVLARDGHTEAAVDLARLAGRHPSGVLCEIVSEEHPTEMARLPELKRFCKKHGFVLTSIVDIAQYRRDTEEHP